MNQHDREKIADVLGKANKMGFLIAALVLLFIIGIESYYVVNPGNVAVKTKLGKVIGAYPEGVHLKMPFIDRVYKFSVLIQRTDVKTEAFSKDLQTIMTEMAVNHRVQQDTIISIYRNLGLNYINTIVVPTVQETIKSITATYSAEEVISQREKIVTELNEQVKERLKKEQIIVTQVAITNLDFTEGFLSSVESKQIAEQRAKESEKLVEKAKMDAQQVIEQAKGEAMSLKLQREVLTPELIELRKVERDIKAIEKWDGRLPTYTGGGAMPFINVGAGTSKRR